MAPGEGGPSQGRQPSRRPARRAGRRPLDPTKDRAITAAVVDVLARLGYGGFTMDEVALAAGVGKAAIYRRWASKADLLAGYTEGSIEGTLDLPDTGSLRNDLVALLGSAATHFNGAAGRANRALLSAVHDDPVLAAAYHAGPVAQWAAAFRVVLDRGARRGEVQDAVRASLATEAGAAVLVQRWLLLGETIDEATVTAVVDDVVLPLLGYAGGRPLPPAPARRGSGTGGPTPAPPADQ